jgi:hypothetical protein
LGNQPLTTVQLVRHFGEMAKGKRNPGKSGHFQIEQRDGVC